MNRLLLCLSVTLLLSIKLNSQIIGPPDPCTDGSENTCQCDTAPVQCTINDLNGFEFSMTTFLHDADGPDPMCSGSQGNNTTSHNPTWFAFLAWCEDLTLNVTASNCIQNPNSCNSLGIQAAVYSDCSLDPNSAVACDTDTGGCQDDYTRTVNITGMNIGDTYFFLVDGCCGSACDILIEVVGSCGLGEIGPWTQEIQGECVLCPDDLTQTYEIDAHPGAVNYYWYIDGAEEGTAAQPALIETFTFPGSGTYDLCIDVDNKPCINQDEDPDPLCKTITVLNTSADAGDITATTSPTCPTEEISYSTTGWADDPAFDQWMILTDDAGVIIEAVEDDEGAYTADECITYTIYSYNFYNDSTFTVPVIGENINDFGPCDLCFCELIMLDITWEDTEDPMFTSPPDDVTITCYDDLGPIGEIDFTDNCLVDGPILGEETGSATACDGGSYTRTWMVTDSCGNTAIHTQTVTVDPIPIAAFDIFPADTTLSCADLIDGDVAINYTNNAPSTCLIEGSVVGTTNDVVDICGGDVTYTWEFEDQCERVITHTQTVTLEGPLEVLFIDVPEDLTITCDDLPFTPVNLDYSNDDEGQCLYDGTDVAPTSVGELLVCGDQITFTWSYTDDCNRTVDTMQVVTLEDTEEPELTDPPGDMTFDCYSEVPVAMDVEWTDNCDGAGLISATENGTIDECTGGSITRTWEYTDACLLSVSHTQTITVNPRPDVVWISALPDDIDVVCGEALPADIDLEYSNSAVDVCLQTGFAPMMQSGTLDVCGDEITRTWEFIPDCGPTVTHTQTITLIDTENPVFVAPPADITFDCFSLVPLAENLTWTDNCDGTGESAPSESGTIDECTGGSITRTWEYTDDCGLPVSHMQTITVNPVPDIDWTDTPPTDIDVVCGEVLPDLLPLNYSNAGIDVCLESGSAIPTESGALLICGDQITRIWEIIPQCGPTLTHTQIITLIDTEEPILLDPPTDMTFNCFSQVPLPEDLDWTDNCDGTGTVSPTEDGTIDECTGGSITRTWEYTDACNLTATHVQTITVNPRPDIMWTTALPTDISVVCDEIADEAITLDFTNNGEDDCLESGTVTATEAGELLICGDQIIRTWEYIPLCGPTLTHTQTITLEDTEAPVLIDGPTDVTLDCYLDVPVGIDLDWTDNCDGTGTVGFTETGTIADCDGGTITRTWTYTDQCNNPITHEQVITVNPTPLAAFISPPIDITVSCQSVPSTAPDLSYSNDETNNCLISGSVPASISGGSDVCGGLVTFTWDFTDDCGRPIQHIQNIVVEEADIASFINPPTDITVECADIPTSFPDLTYDNNLSDDCSITGSVPAVQNGSTDECGGDFSVTWTYTDDCGRTIDHEQIITVNPAPPAAFTDLPINLTVACSELPDSPPFLDYSNNSTGVCLIEGSVEAEQEGFTEACGGVVTYSWIFTDECGRTINHEQNYTLLEADQAEFIDPPSDITISCSDLPFSPVDLSFSNGDTGKCLIESSVVANETGQADECGGLLTYSWQYTDECNRTIVHVQNVLVEPSEAAIFINPPGDVTISCFDAASAVQPLLYDNNLAGICEISGQSNPSFTGSYDLCGGELFVAWEFTDFCNRTIQEEQIIIIEPAPEAQFLNVPADITVDCNNVDPIIPDLDFNNNLTGVCGISGSTSAISTGFYDTCGGTLTYSWVHIDDCNRTIIAEQQVTIMPAPDPVFITTPQDITIYCGDPDYIPEDLDYTNNETGICELSGTVSPTLEITNNIIDYTWSFENPCSGELLEHTQQVTNSIEPDIFVVPDVVTICLGDTYDLQDLLIEDLFGTAITYSFHSAFPTNVTNQINNTVVSPTAETVYYIFAENEFFCEDFELFTIQVDLPFNAGDDGSGMFCNDETSIDLFSYLSNVDDFSGQWTSPAGSGIDVSNPMSVDFTNVSGGNYTLEYSISSDNSCPSATASLDLEVFESLSISVTSIECSMNQDFYTVNINATDGTVTASTGTVMDLGGGNWSIADIMIADAVTIDALNPDTQCTDQLILNPPNCDCPDVDPPTVAPIPTICGADSPITLQVMVGPDATANWYSDPARTDQVASMSTTYTFTETAAGTYSYYVEAQSTLFPECVSLSTVTVEIEIAPDPAVNNAQIYQCDDDEDGFSIFNLSDAENQIGGNANYTYSYHLTLAEANDGTNALSNPYTNTVANQQTIYVQVSSSFGCISAAEVLLEVWPIPVLNIEISDETCLNSGDGYVVPNPSSGTGTIELSLDGLSYTQVDTFKNLDAGAYTLYVRDENGCQNTTPFTIGEGLMLNLDLFDFACSSNDTATDPDDDFYELNFNIGSNLGINGQYQLFIDNTLEESYNYQNQYTITLPADGTTVTLQFIDVINGCELTQTLGPLNSCSTDCDINFDVLTFECNGNGTLSDPNDDFYTININASAENGSSTNSYNVFIDGTLTFNYNYGSLESFQLPADGSLPSIQIVDNEDAQCQENMSIGPLNSCSDLCILDLDIVEVSCDNIETQNNVEDDTYTIEFVVSGSNVSGGWMSSDGLYSGNYNENITIGPFLIIDGNTSFTIIDNDDANCTFDFDVSPPPPCSAPCEIIMNNLTVGNCNDNNTGTIETDDTFTLSFQVDVIDGATNQYIIEIAGSTYGPYAYGVLINIDNLEADGLTYMAAITDITFGQCLTEFDFTAPTPCSSCTQTVEAGNDVLLDCNNSTASLFAMGSETASYIWNGPNFFFADIQNPTVGAPGTYIVEASFMDGCTATDSLVITVDDDIPIANAGPDQSITCEVSQVTLEAIVDDLENIEIIWTDVNGVVISNDLSITTDILGSYYLQLIDTINNCQSAIDEVLVLEDTQDPIAIIFTDPGNQIDCVVASVQVTNEIEEGVVYTWLFNGTTPNIEPFIITEPGLIELFALDTINGCNSMSSLQIVDIQDFPIAMINPADALDCINNEVELSAFDSPINNNVIYIWYDTDFNLISFDQLSTNINMGGQYFLEAVDTINNCRNTDSIFVQDLSDVLDLDAGEDLYLNCGELDGSITAQLGGNIADYTIEWSTVDGNINSPIDQLNIDIIGSGTYVINAVNTVSSCDGMDTVFVFTTDGLTTSILTVDDVNCHGQNDGLLMIDQVIGGEAPYMFSLNGGPFTDNDDFDNLAPGNYTLDINDVNGCSLDTSFVITEPDEISLSLSADIMMITAGESTQLLGEINFPIDQVDNIDWSPSVGLSCTDCLDPIATPDITTTYTLSVTDLNGCIVSDAVIITVEQVGVKTYIPNIFSPNGDDNGNDNFTFYSDDSVELIEKMQIYDRWGELIFSAQNIEPNNPLVGWDGRFKGRDVMNGVYVYKFDILFKDMRREIFSGDLTVVR